MEGKHNFGTPPMTSTKKIAYKETVADSAKFLCLTIKSWTGQDFPEDKIDCIAEEEKKKLTKN